VGWGKKLTFEMRPIPWAHSQLLLCSSSFSASSYSCWDKWVFGFPGDSSREEPKRLGFRELGIPGKDLLQLVLGVLVLRLLRTQTLLRKKKKSEGKVLVGQHNCSA